MSLLSDIYDKDVSDKDSLSDENRYSSQTLSPFLILLLLLLSFISSVQFSHSVVSNCLWPHGLQHAKPPCPSSSPRVCPSSCPLHWWCHPAILSFDTLFLCSLSPCHQGLFQSWLFTSGDQNTSASTSTSVLPMSIQGWFPLILPSLISLLSKGLSRVFSSTTVQRH